MIPILIALLTAFLPPPVPDHWDAQPPPMPRSVLGAVVWHFPAEEWDAALCVIEGESSGDPAQRGDDGHSIGLFQIKWDNLAGRNVIAGLRSEFGPGSTNGIIRRTEATALLLDPWHNVRVAAAIWRANGWLPAWLAQKWRCDLQ